MIYMNEDRFEYFETTADIGIEIYSKSLDDAFINSALATMNLVTDVDRIREVKTMNITLEGEDEYGLLFDWITEVLLLLDCDFFIASKYELNITRNGETYILDATLTGDTYDRNIYNYKTEVKAITYHNMLIEKVDEMYHIRFIVDL